MEVQSHDVHKNTSFICLIESQCLAVSAVYRYTTKNEYHFLPGRK